MWSSIVVVCVYLSGVWHSGYRRGAAEACVRGLQVSQWLAGGLWMGWDASRLEGMGGREFLASVASQERSANFSQIEQLRWLAAALPTKEHSSAVLAIAKTLATTPPITKKNLKSSEKADEMDADPIGPAVSKTGTASTPTAQPTEPVVVPPIAIHVEGTSYFETGGITV